jgi:hypothetical protein
MIKARSSFFSGFLGYFPILFPTGLPKMSAATVDIRRVVKNHPILSASGAAVLAVSALAATYSDRAVFHPSRKDIPRYPGWPLIGNLPTLLQYKDKIYDCLLEGFELVGSPNT